MAHVEEYVLRLEDVLDRIVGRKPFDHAVPFLDQLGLLVLEFAKTLLRSRKIVAGIDNVVTLININTMIEGFLHGYDGGVVRVDVDRLVFRRASAAAVVLVHAVEQQDRRETVDDDATEERGHAVQLFPGKDVRVVVEKEQEILAGPVSGRGRLVGALLQFEETIDQTAGNETRENRWGDVRGKLVTDVVQRGKVEDGLMKNEFHETTLLR